MISKHFQLHAEPFQKAIPEGGLLRSRAFEEGLRRLEHLLATDGIGLLIGETGSGKTTLLDAYTSSLDPGRVRLCYVCFTSLSPFAFLLQVATQLGLPPARFKVELVRQILEAIRSNGRRTILVVDEAHRLPEDTLEDLRLLTAADYDRSPFTLLLAGQPLLKDRLGEPNLLALLDRITIRHTVAPLSEDETAAYIEHRLAACGGDAKCFDRSAIEAIFGASRGIPRRINTLTALAMLASISRGKRYVTTECVQDATLEIEYF